jgi:hypothetical protein
LQGCDHRFTVSLTCGHFHDASLTDGSPHLTGRLAGVFARHRATRGDEVGLRLEPDGCHLFPADDSGTSAVREYASA